ncbi:MAG: succinylglutamate desuccinylase/aspartoacylase family protein [Pirellulaceae bacterium]|jgi:predicted deacylase
MISTSIDFSRPGRQQGFLRVPYSHNLGGWAQVMIPITTIARGEGPTVLVLGGNHGDEYQGQVAAMNLARTLKPEELRGRLILIPSLNFPAAQAATRLSPLDGMNLNRAFPGTPDGPVTSQIAHYLTHTLFPMSDVVIDIHSGGRGMEFVPCAHMHVVEDLDQRRRMMEAMLAWGTDFAFLYADIAGTGLLPVEAENQGKLVVTTELGGGEGVSAAVHRIAQKGLRQVLIHVGLLAGDLPSRRQLGLPETILVEALEGDNYLMAPRSGILEMMADLGAWLKQGDPIGALHDLEQPDRQPAMITSPRDGYLICHRVPCRTQQGDCIAVIAQPADPKEVLSRTIRKGAV